MKKGANITGKTLLALFIIASTAFILISWGNRQQPGQLKQDHYYKDTVPPKKNKKRSVTWMKSSMNWKTLT